MFRNFLKVAVRNILRQKGYSFINVAGLAVGMACCILIFLWVQDELGYDGFHEHADDLYLIATEAHYTNNSSRFFGSPMPLGPALKDEIADVLNTCRVINAGRLLIASEDSRYYEDNVQAVDPSFLQMFTFPLSAGDRQTALAEPASILLTERMAEKYFGTENPVGRMLTLENQLACKVTGVMENIPANSHLAFDFLIPVELLLQQGIPTHWGGTFYRTYVQTQPGVSYRDLNAALPEWTKAHTVEPVTYFLWPLTDIHLRSLRGGGAIVYVYAFSAVAVFILLIACINFMNLATARSRQRSLEVGVRKVIGAHRGNIIRQFFGESMLMSLLSLVFALILAEMFLPTFNGWAGKQLSLNLTANLFVPLSALAVALFCGFISGSYPALFLSSFKPINTLKGSSAGSFGGCGRLRKVLVVFQFTLGIIFLVGTTVVFKQIGYIRHKNLGYDKDYMICIPIRGDLAAKYDAFKSELLRNPQVVSVTGASGMPTGRVNWEWGQINWEGKAPDAVVHMAHIAVEHDFIQNFGMDIIDGRDFSPDIAADTLNYILNEAALRATGLQSPLGTEFTLLYRTGTVVGIIRDFHFGSLYSEIDPLIIRLLPSANWHFVFVRVRPDNGDPTATLAFLEETWGQFLPTYPFEYEFLDQSIDELYRREQRMRAISTYASGIALFIAFLGLFGVASYSTEQRTREIGIRKVFGASIAHIITITSREFILLVALANLIGLPIAYYIMSRWLERFAYRTGLGIDIFLAAGLAALAIALATVSFQSIRAALANPVDAIRHE